MPFLSKVLNCNGIFQLIIKREEQPQWPMTCSLFNYTISTRQTTAETNIAHIRVIIWKYSEPCLSWPLTVPERVVNVSKWPTYTNVSQNNFHGCILFPASDLLMHIEIAQHINGDNYGQKIIDIFVRHPRTGIRCRQYTFLIYLLRYAFCFAEIVFGKIRIGFYSACLYRGTCEDLISHTQI